MLSWLPNISACWWLQHNTNFTFPTLGLHPGRVTSQDTPRQSCVQILKFYTRKTLGANLPACAIRLDYGQEYHYRLLDSSRICSHANFISGCLPLAQWGLRASDKTLVQQFNVTEILVWNFQRSDPFAAQAENRWRAFHRLSPNALKTGGCRG